MQCKIRKIYNLDKNVRARSRKLKLKNKFQFVALLENAVGNAVLSVPKEFWGSMPQNSYDFHDLPYKYMPLRGRNAEDSVPYGMLYKLQLERLQKTLANRGKYHYHKHSITKNEEDP